MPWGDAGWTGRERRLRALGVLLREHERGANARGAGSTGVGCLHALRSTEYKQRAWVRIV